MRRWLLFLSAFIGIGAYFGAFIMFTFPSGVVLGIDQLLFVMQEKMPFADIFFRNFLWSGVALALVNGVSNTIAWVALRKNKLSAPILQLICGIMLLLWLGVQWMIFEINVLTTLYTALSIVQIFLSLSLLRSTKRSDNTL